MTVIPKPDLPSSVLEFIGQAATRIDPTFNQVVAIPGVWDWGPMADEPDGAKLYASLSKYEEDYGTSDSAGRDAAVGAFLGMNVPGGGGAGGIIPVRMGTNAAAAATLQRQNTTPANALLLTAKYKGTRGNLLSVVIEDDPFDVAKDRLRILFNGATMETYSYLATDIAALAAAINARSRWVKAQSQITGVALSPTPGTALAGGNDGSAVTVAEYGAALTSLEYRSFGILAPFNLTDIPTKVVVANWVKTQASEMRPIRLVIGGAAGEDISDALTELDGSGGALRDPHIIRFAVGTYHDDVLNKDLSTAQLAPRIAGVLAARGLKSALTRAALGGLHVVGATGATTADLITGRDGGLTMLRRVSNADAELAVSQGVTTFISKTTAGRPYDLFSEPRIVGLFDDLVHRMSTWGEDVIIGDVTVTDDTRNTVRNEVTKILNEYVAEGLAQPGTTSVTADPPDDPGLQDAVPYTFAFKPTRTANYLIGEGRVS